MQMDLYSEIMKVLYPEECVYHSSIIGRVGDIQGHYVQVLFQFAIYNPKIITFKMIFFIDPDAIYLFLSEPLCLRVFVAGIFFTTSTLNLR